MNRRGSAVGYHYEMVNGTNGSIIPGTQSSANSLGVYRGQVQVNGIIKSGNGGFSTFFPRSMSPQEVVNAINEAYASKVLNTGNEYYGYSNNGMRITMYLNKEGKIISAFPAQ